MISADMLNGKDVYVLQSKVKAARAYKTEVKKAMAVRMSLRNTHMHSQLLNC